jgi:hypothetical protein
LIFIAALTLLLQHVYFEVCGVELEPHTISLRECGDKMNGPTIDAKEKVVEGQHERGVAER